MSQTQSPASISTALKRGWLFGFIMLGIYLLYLIIDRVTLFTSRLLLSQNVPPLVIQYTIPAILMLLSFIVFLIAGLQASTRTGQASSGWIAGNFAGLVYGVGSFLIFATYLFAFFLPYLSITPKIQYLYWSELNTELNNQLVTITLFGGIFMGNLGGIIGGLLGKNRTRAFSPTPSVHNP